MPRIVREADVAWEGNLARGHGALSAATSGAFIGLSYSLPTRIGDPDGKTSPEELLAAAHGGCFTMSLSGELTAAGTPPGRLSVRCRITMDEVEGEGHRIVHSALDVHVRAAGLDAEALQAATDAADGGCSFSALLRAAGVGIDVTTTLEEGGDENGN
jgi:osmotically inducible protein OsmC